MVCERAGVVLKVKLVEEHIRINELMWVDLAVVKVWHVGDVVTKIEIKDDKGRLYNLEGEMVFK